MDRVEQTGTAGSNRWSPRGGLSAIAPTIRRSGRAHGPGRPAGAGRTRRPPAGVPRPRPKPRAAAGRTPPARDTPSAAARRRSAGTRESWTTSIAETACSAAARPVPAPREREPRLRPSHRGRVQVRRVRSARATAAAPVRSPLRRRIVDSSAAPCGPSASSAASKRPRRQSTSARPRRASATMPPGRSTTRPAVRNAASASRSRPSSASARPLPIKARVLTGESGDQRRACSNADAAFCGCPRSRKRSPSAHEAAAAASTAPRAARAAAQRLSTRAARA